MTRMNRPGAVRSSVVRTAVTVAPGKRSLIAFTVGSCSASSGVIIVLHPLCLAGSADDQDPQEDRCQAGDRYADNCGECIADGFHGHIPSVSERYRTASRWM